MRKTKTLTIEAAGRDQGKVFFLQEMPASQAERWAARALLALARSGAEIPEDIASAGLAGIAAVGFKLFGGIRFEDAELLLAEMFSCVAIVPNPAKPNIYRGGVPGAVGALVEDDIEEITTRIQLRKEVFGLHVDFSAAGALLTSARASAGQAEEQQTASTSPGPSQP